MDAAGRQIVFINAAHLLCHYSLLILPTAVLAMAAPGGAFGSEYGPIVALATSMFVLYGVLSLPQGWLTARLGRKAMIATFFLGTGASLAVCAFAHTPWALAGGRGGTPAGACDRAVDRGQRGVRQFRRGAGAGRDRVPGRYVRVADGVRGAGPGVHGGGCRIRDDACL